MNNFCIIINTTSKSKDVWPLFFGQLEKFLPEVDKKYVFVDETDYDFGDDYDVFFYDKQKKYSEQMIECFPKVEQKYCLYLQEDYVLYNKVDWDALNKCIDFLEFNDNIDFIKLIRGTENIKPLSDDVSMGLYLNYILKSDMYYTTQPTIWRMNKLIKVFDETPTSHIGDDNDLHFEVLAHDACVKNCYGLIYYNNESKRGMHHYNSDIFPYVASAIIRGKWNISEYKEELVPLLDFYKINIDHRGVY